MCVTRTTVISEAPKGLLLPHSPKTISSPACRGNKVFLTRSKPLLQSEIKVWLRYRFSVKAFQEWCGQSIGINGCRKRERNRRTKSGNVQEGKVRKRRGKTNFTRSTA